MAYLIDSDWVIDHLANVPEATHLLERLAPQGIALSIVTYMEAYQGTLRATEGQEEAEALLSAFIEAVPIIPVTPAIARRCAQLRQTSKSQRKRVNSRALDLVIAATALHHDLTLVTRNLDDYQDIPALRLYRAN